MGEDVRVVRDERVAYDDGTITSVRVLSVPESERFEDGVKYAFHYGLADEDDPIIRFDNHHGVHELHIGEHLYAIEYPGLATLYEAWRAALPFDNRQDW